MALNQDQLASLLENLASKGSRRLPSLVNAMSAQPAESELGSLQQQSSNLATRISATGTPPKTDTRNPLEQMLNLTPDQNFLFDFFEVINRPQQALFGAISALQRGEDVGKGAWEGFTRTGDGIIDGGDLIRNMFGQTEDPNEGDIGKQIFDLTNWAGFALDVLADPADLGLLLVTGGAGNVAKEVAQTGAKLTDVTMEAMQAGAKVAGAVDNVADVAKVAQGPTQNFLESLLLPNGQQYYNPKDLGEYMRMITPIIGRKERALKQITKTSFQNMAMQPLFKGMKMGTKLSDGAVSKALEMADPHTLESYKALKKSIQGTVSEGGAKVKQAVGAMSNRLALATGVFKAVHTDYADYLYKLAQDTGRPVDDIAQDILRYHEFANVPREISNVDFVNFIVGAPNKFVPITDDTMDNIRALFGDEAFAMVKVRDLGPFKVAEFDPKYWNLENYSKLIKATEKDGMSNILTSSSRLEFEQSLKMKNPDEYATYSKLKSDYEADLNQRIEKQLEQEYPKASGVDEKKLATKRRSIEKRLRTEDLVAGRGPEFYLRSKVNSSEVSNYVMGKETRIHFVDQLTDADTLTYKRLLDQDNAEIDAMVTKKYPHVEGQTADVRKAYDEQRRAYTAELRTDPASYKRSDDFLRKAIKEQDNTNITLFKSEDELNAFMEGDLAQVKKEVKHYPKAFKDKVIEVKKAETRVTELLAKGKGPGSKAYDNARAYLDKVRKELYLDYVDETMGEVAPKVDVAGPTNVGYHYGDLNAPTKAEPMGRATGSRGTGHFGTGTYIVGEGGNVGSLAEKTKNTIDMEGYTLYTPETADEAFQLHDTLREVNRSVDVLINPDGKTLLMDPDLASSIVDLGSNPTFVAELEGASTPDGLKQLIQRITDSEDVLFDETAEEVEAIMAQQTLDDFAEFLDNLPRTIQTSLKKMSDTFYGTFDEEAVTQLAQDIDRLTKVVKPFQSGVAGSVYGIKGISNQRQVRQAVRDIIENTKKYVLSGQTFETSTTDSASTALMKSIGYDGVDTRHLPQLNNSEYGSVIYDTRAPGEAVVKYEKPAFVVSSNPKADRNRNELLRKAKANAEKAGIKPLDQDTKNLVAQRTAQNISDPKNYGNGVTEMVKVNDALAFVEFDRASSPIRGDNHLKELADSITEEGFREPIMLELNPETGVMSLGEGNHRLVIAYMLGLDEIPVRVSRSYIEASPLGGVVKVDPNKVTGYIDGLDGKHFKSEMLPSEAGIPARSLNDVLATKAPEPAPTEVAKPSIVNVFADKRNVGPISSGTVISKLEQSLNYHPSVAESIQQALVSTPTRGAGRFFVDGSTPESLSDLMVKEGVLPQDMRDLLSGKMWARDFINKYPAFKGVLLPDLTLPTNTIGNGARSLSNDDLDEIVSLIDENMGELIGDTWTQARDDAVRRVVEPTPTGRPKKITDRFIQLVNTALNVQEYGTEELRDVLIKIDREFGTELAEHKAFRNALNAERSVKARPMSESLANIRQAVVNMRSANSMDDITQVAQSIEEAGRSVGLSAKQARTLYENFREAIRKSGDWDSADFGVKALDDLFNDKTIALDDLPNKISEKVEGLSKQTPAPTTIADDIVDSTGEKMDQFLVDELGPTKAVDDAGRPVLLHHGSDLDIEDYLQVDDNADDLIYFSSNPKVATKYGAKTSTAYVKMDNPLVVDAGGSRYNNIKVKGAVRKEIIDVIGPDAQDMLKELDADQLAEFARTMGYDGVIIKNVYETDEAIDPANLGDDYIVWDKDKIVFKDFSKSTGDVVDVKALDEATASIPPQTPPTPTPTVPAGKPTSIKIGNYYTQEQLDYFNSIKDQAWLKEGVQKFQETITKVQRTIGDLEFRDPDAIVRQSMQGYATHAVTPGVKQVLKDMWEKKMLKNGDAVTQFTPSKISPLKTRQYLGSAQEVNNFRKALYQEYFQNDEWLKANLIDIDDDLALQKLDEYFNQDLFSEDSRHSIEALMTETYSAIHKNHRTTEALIAMSLGNPNGEKSAIRVVKSGTGQVGGFIPLSLKETQNLLNALKSNQQFAGKGFFSDKLIDTLKEGLKTGNSVVVEEHLAKIIGAGDDRTPKGALELLDKFNRMFKLGKTLSPGFNGKNLFGNAFNMWASGMELQDIAKYWNRAVVQHKTMKNIYAKLASTAPEEIIGADGTKTFKRVLDILSPEERKLYDVYQEFLDAGFLEKASVYKLQDIPLKVEGDEVIWEKSFSETTSATDKAKTIFDNPLSQANMAGNLFVDNHSRLALYLYAKEHPEYLSRLGFDPNDAKSAMNAVRFALFDPNDLTFFEDDVMKRLVPFYTFTRQNLLYQMKNLAKNSDRYYKLYKAYNAWNQEFADLSPEEMTDYQRNQFYLPVFGKKDGEFFTIKTSIPASALTEFSFDPQEVFQNYGSMLSPAFKAPFEWATGTSVFSGEPIERYEGEPGKNIGIGGNMLSKVDEWGLSQVGLDVPARGVTGLVDMLGSLASGKPSEAVGGLNRFTGLTTQVSPERNAMSREYDRIEALNAQVRRLKESGIKVPTLDEIASTLQTTRNDKRLADMQAIVEMINKIKR